MYSKPFDLAIKPMWNRLQVDVVHGPTSRAVQRIIPRATRCLEEWVCLSTGIDLLPVCFYLGYKRTMLYKQAQFLYYSVWHSTNNQPFTCARFHLAFRRGPSHRTVNPVHRSCWTRIPGRVVHRVQSSRPSWTERHFRSGTTSVLHFRERSCTESPTTPNERQI